MTVNFRDNAVDQKLVDLTVKTRYDHLLAADKSFAGDDKSFADDDDKFPF